MVQRNYAAKASSETPRSVATSLSVPALNEESEKKGYAIDKRMCERTKGGYTSNANEEWGICGAIVSEGLSWSMNS